mgnify:CR=1 FL=1
MASGGVGTAITLRERSATGVWMAIRSRLEEGVYSISFRFDGKAGKAGA